MAVIRKLQEAFSNDRFGLNHGAAYLGRQCKDTKKNNRLFHLSPTCDGNVRHLVTFLCVSMYYKA